MKLVFICLLLVSLQSHAWGRRGHSIVCETAAALVGGDLMREHAFDLGYYCNVPDLVWKKPATYTVEAPQHFMDLEIFTRAGVTSADFALSREDFERKFPSLPASAGRSYWRIRELMDSLSSQAEAMRMISMALSPPGATTPSASVTAASSTRFELQEKWLVVAGAIGHYVGDLSQPLHVTEDYDGQQENQKGVHAYFEDRVVDELSTPPQLEVDVQKQAMSKWKEFEKIRGSFTTLQLLEDLAKDSGAQRAELLKIDKKIGRGDIRKSAAAYAPMIRDRLTAGALTLALLWSRENSWPYIGEKFYNFAGWPAYIQPGSVSRSRASASKPPTPDAASTSAIGNAVATPTAGKAGPAKSKFKNID